MLRAAKGEVVQAQIFIESLLGSSTPLHISSLGFAEQSGSGWSAQGLGAPQLGRLCEKSSSIFPLFPSILLTFHSVRLCFCLHWSGYAPIASGGEVYPSAVLHFGATGAKSDIATEAFTIVSKNDEFYITNEELCIKNEEFCIKNEKFCSPLKTTTSQARPTKASGSASSYRRELQLGRIR